MILWKRRLAVIAVVLIHRCGGCVRRSSPASSISTTTVAVRRRSPGFGVIAADNLSALLGTYAQTAESDVIKDWPPAPGRAPR